MDKPEAIGRDRVQDRDIVTDREVPAGPVDRPLDAACREQVRLAREIVDPPDAGALAAPRLGDSQ